MKQSTEEKYSRRSEIAIVVPNTLSAIGLSSILERMIPMAIIRSFSSFAALIDDTPDMYAHYFISAQVYIEHTAFFLPRKSKVIVLTGSESQPLQLVGMPTLSIYQPEEKLVKDILKLHQHAHRNGQPTSANRHPSHSNTTNKNDLSTREIEVLALLSRGFINKEIAEKLHISLSTVITHRKNITDKLGIKSVSGLTIYAVMNGYIEADCI